MLVYITLLFNESNLLNAD